MELEDLEDQSTRKAEAKLNAMKYVADLVEKDQTSFVQQAQVYQGLENLQQQMMQLAKQALETGESQYKALYKAQKAAYEHVLFLIEEQNNQLLCSRLQLETFQIQLLNEFVDSATSQQRK